MWIAIVLVVMVNGQLIQDYGVTATETECRAELDKLDKYLAGNSKAVAGYKAECVSTDDLKKPGAPA